MWVPLMLQYLRRFGIATVQKCGSSRADALPIQRDDTEFIRVFCRTRTPSPTASADYHADLQEQQIDI